jgi:hypothetical protein
MKQLLNCKNGERVGKHLEMNVEISFLMDELAELLLKTFFSELNEENKFSSY